jgi:hypothetical protein
MTLSYAKGVVALVEVDTVENAFWFLLANLVRGAMYALDLN